MPGEMCELLRCYIFLLLERLKSIHDVVIFEPEMEILKELMSQVESGAYDSSHMAGTLRAFYCLESLLMQLRGNLITLGMCPSLGPLPARTYEGLMGIGAELEDANGGLSALDVDLRLKGAALNRTSAAIDYQRAGVCTKVLPFVRSMVSELKGRLTREPENGRKISVLFFEGHVLVDYNVTKMVKHAYNLINITKENAITPWTLTSQQA